MEQILNKENYINNSNRQSTLDTNKNSILFFNKGNYFSFGKDNIIDNKIAPNTSSFNIRDSFKSLWIIIQEIITIVLNKKKDDDFRRIRIRANSKGKGKKLKK